MSNRQESQNINREKFRFAIDRGGTFTDVYSECPNGEVKVMKLLSVDPAYPDAPREGIRRILEQVKCCLWKKIFFQPPKLESLSRDDVGRDNNARVPEIN